MAFNQTKPDPDDVRPSRSDRIRTLAMIVFVANVFGLLVVLMGLVTGWFRVSAGRGTEDGQFRFGLTVNMSEVADDVETMVDETQEVSEKVGTAAEMETVSGAVQAYDRTAGVLTVRQEKETIAVKVTEATEFETDGAESKDWRISTGDNVQVVYRIKGEENFAVKVQREPDKE